jgi:RNA polymerase sigma-70 factor (family 1)
MREPSRGTDNILLERLKAGDTLAFKAIYERYWQRLYRLALSKTRVPGVAEELVQEIFVRLWERRDGLNVDNLEAYLTTAVRYGVISYFRQQISTRQHTAVLPDDIDPATASDIALTVREIRTTIDEAIANLPDKTRQIFTMSRFEELPHKQIANALEVSEKTVEYHITQALKSLRTRLRDFLPL